MQLKHSRGAGHVPNLIPGEVGVNLPDEAIFIRAGGKKLRVPIEVINTRAPPKAGPHGAPLVRTDLGVDWSRDLTPSSLNFDGRIYVDAPPAGGYAVPGVYGVRLEPDCLLSAGELAIEPFEVVSDDFNLSAFAIRLTSPPDGPIRMGVADSTGVIIADAVIAYPVAGLNRLGVNLPLSRGSYRALLWTGADVTLRQMLGWRREQGFDFNGAGEVIFTRSYRGAPGAYGSGLTDADPVLAVTSLVPGELHTMLFDWTLDPI